MFESCVIPAGLEHEFILAELPDLCKGATFSAPTVEIDCTGNRSCQGISFDKDVVATIKLTCGPNIMDNKVDENFVCTDIEIPDEADCMCISTEVTDPWNDKADTSCPCACTPEGCD